MEAVEPTANAAYYLAGTHESEIGTLSSEVKSTKSLLAAFSQQTNQRFEHVNRRLDTLETRISQGFDQITGLLHRVIERDERN